MKKLLVLLSSLVLAFTLALGQAHAVQLGGKEIVKSGTGERTKTLLGTMYYATLWIVPELKGKDGTAIVDSDTPMSVVLQIDSRLLSRDRFLEAVKEGFARAAKSGYPTSSLPAFIKLFDGVEFSKGDIIYLNYVPGSGVTAAMTTKDNGKTRTLGTTAGLEFKKALFAVWLGPSPAQASLKKSMLGGK